MTAADVEATPFVSPTANSTPRRLTTAQVLVKTAGDAFGRSGARQIGACFQRVRESRLFIGEHSPVAHRPVSDYRAEYSAYKSREFHEEYPVDTPAYPTPPGIPLGHLHGKPWIFAAIPPARKFRARPVCHLIAPLRRPPTQPLRATAIAAGGDIAAILHAKTFHHANPFDPFNFLRR